MKKIRLCMLASLAAIVGFTSCEKPLETPPEPAKSMKTDAQTTYDVLSVPQRDIKFNINSNTPWSIESDAEWCSATPASSEESSLVEEITVKIEENTNPEPRTAKLTIKGEGVNEPVVITFNQSAKGMLEITSITEAFTPAGGEKTFTVLSNMDWTAESNMEWLVLDKTSGTAAAEAQTIKVTCAENTGGERKAVITISAGGEQKNFEVAQEGLYARFKEVAADGLKLNRQGGSKLFEIETNAAELDITSDKDFARGELVEGKVKVTVDFNKIFITRKANITIVPKGKNAEDFEGNVIEISQDPAFIPDINGDGKVTIDPETGAATLESINSDRARVRTQDYFTLGKYTVEFESVEVTENFWIDMNFYAGRPVVHWEVYLGTNLNENALNQQNTPLNNVMKTWAGGKDKKRVEWPTVPGFSNSYLEFDFTLQDALSLKKLVLDMKPLDNNKDKIKVTLTANEKVLIDTELTNPYTWEGKKDGEKVTYPKGMMPYIGFSGKSGEKVCHSPGKMVIKSIDIVRY